MKNGKLEVAFLPVDKQTDGFICGLFALGYASICWMANALLMFGLL